MRTDRRSRYAAMVGLAGAAALTACGGGSDDTTPPPVTPGAATVAIRGTAAKLLFSEIKSDWASVFSRGGDTAIAGGAVNRQANKFNAAMTGIQVPVEVLAKDLGAMLLGVDLYNDYKAGRSLSLRQMNDDRRQS